MTQLATSILDQFVESFPNSAHYRGGRKLRLSGWSNRIAGIDRDVEQKEAFLEAVEELIELGLVSVKWTRFREGTEIEAIYLEDPEAAYRALGKLSPDSIRQEMLDALDSPEWEIVRTSINDTRGEQARSIHEWLRAELEARHPVALPDASAVSDLARVLTASTQLIETLPLRALSVRLFSNSKRLEALIESADRICMKAIGTRLSETLGLARSYPEATFALCGSISFAGSHQRTWSLEGEPITFPAETVSAIHAIEIDSNAGPCGPRDRFHRILSVENKETFYAFATRLRRVRAEAIPKRFGWSGIVYCAGHPSGVIIELLRKLLDSRATLDHFGDLDPDGLLILTELARALDCDVHPVCMNPVVYRRYLEYGYPLSKVAVARLDSGRRRLPVSLGALSDEIIANRIGVEQEVIDPDETDGFAQ